MHGAVGEVTSSGFIIDFSRHRGFLPRHEVPKSISLGRRDEVEAWIAELDLRLRWIGLTALVPWERPPNTASGLIIRPDLTPPGRPKIRMGEGVPFHELYMRRRSTRSWSRG